jgi:hypothetical protein
MPRRDVAWVVRVMADGGWNLVLIVGTRRRSVRRGEDDTYHPYFLTQILNSGAVSMATFKM